MLLASQISPEMISFGISTGEILSNSISVVSSAIN